MTLIRRLSVGLSAIALLLLAASSALAADKNDHKSTSSIERVLLISVDGMHAVDFLNCANGITTVNNGQPYCPARPANSSRPAARPFPSLTTSAPTAFRPWPKPHCR